MDVCTIPTLTSHTPSPTYLFAYSCTFYTTPKKSINLSFYFVHYTFLKAIYQHFNQNQLKALSHMVIS